MTQQVAYVRWIDSAIYQGDIFTIEDIEDQPLNMESCGLLVKEDENQITLALDHSPENGHYRCLITIPKFAIKSTRRFKV